jgi:hypothetical protein
VNGSCQWDKEIEYKFKRISPQRRRGRREGQFRIQKNFTAKAQGAQRENNNVSVGRLGINYVSRRIMHQWHNTFIDFKN